MGFLSSLFGGNNPPHMKGCHKDTVKEYYKLREHIGDPFSQRMEDVVNKIVRYQLKLPSGQELNSSVRLVGDLGCDELDIVELVMAIEDQFEKKFEYPDWFENDPAKVTLADFYKP